MKTFKKQPAGIQRILNAFRFSMAGLKAALGEPAFREEALLFLVIAPLGWWLGENGVERTLLIGSWVFVMVVELLNTGIESVVDRVGLEMHELAGRAKDMGSAAVLLSISMAIATWLLILL